METVNVDVKSKMSQVAKKAWITIRAKKLAGQANQVVAVLEIKHEKQKKRVKEVKEKNEKEIVEKATAWEKRELDELNGVELVKLARGNGKRVERNLVKQGFEAAERAIQFGEILKGISIENGTSGYKKEDV